MNFYCVSKVPRYHDTPMWWWERYVCNGFQWSIILHTDEKWYLCDLNLDMEKHNWVGPFDTFELAKVAAELLQ